MAGVTGKCTEALKRLGGDSWLVRTPKHRYLCGEFM